MIELGLEDLSVSRAQVEWGVPVPWDPEQTIYVWIDALLNYRTALGYARPGEDLVERYWPPDLQLMAKDILKFHAVIWPAMLMAAGLELPRRLMIHGYVLKGGEKMSKTTGNVVDPFPFIERYGIDALRYYLAREVRFGEDGTFTAEGFEARYSQELANELGNLLNRVVSMIGRYRDGVVPARRRRRRRPGAPRSPPRPTRSRGELRPRSTSRAASRTSGASCSASTASSSSARRGRSPRTPRAPAELDQTLFSLAEGLRVAAILLWPVIPGVGRAHPRRAGPGPGATWTLARGRLGRGRGGRRRGARRPALPPGGGGGGVVDTHAHLDSCDAPPAELVAEAAAARGGADRRHRRGAGVERAGRRPGGGAPRACSRPSACTPTTPTASRRPTRSWIRALLAHPRVVAVGECGLDYYRDHARPEAQRARVLGPDRAWRARPACRW